MFNIISMLFILQGQQPGNPLLGMLIPMGAIAVIFYLLIFRPMRKRQKQLDSMIANLKNGDKVITSGGIYGTVSGLREKTVILKVADNVKIEVAKTAIAGMQPLSAKEIKK